VQLGDNSAIDQLVPVAVVGLGSGVVAVALGYVRLFLSLVLF
jgi:hypothetical protein